MNTRAALIHAGHVDHCEMPLLRQGSPKKMQEERKSWRRTLVDRFFLWWGTGPALHSCLWQTSAPTPQCPVPFGAVSPCILPCRCFSQSIFVSSSCQIALVAQMLLDLSISGVQPSSCWKCGAWRLMRRLSVFLFADGELRVPPLVPLSSFQRNGGEGWWELQPRNKALSGVHRRFSCDTGWWFCP